MVVRNVELNDVNNCMEFLEIVKDNFVGYDKKEFMEVLKKSIISGEAILATTHEIVGLLLFSKEDKELSFLAVHPEYRRQGIAYELMDKMMMEFSLGETIKVITFRDGDEKGIAARRFYHKYGFEDAQLLEVFDYPCQKLIYKVK